MIRCDCDNHTPFFVHVSIVCDIDLEHSYRTNTEDVKAGLDQVCDRFSNSEIAAGESSNWFIPGMI